MKRPQIIILCVSCFALMLFIGCKNHNTPGNKLDIASANNDSAKKPVDAAVYKNLLQQIANGDTTGKWPADAPYPLPGAILPYYRIVAFYGNLYSKRMGILGELPKDSMLKKLQYEINRWKAADSSLPIKPALHYIAVSAQGMP